LVREKREGRRGVPGSWAGEKKSKIPDGKVRKREGDADQGVKGGNTGIEL